ncbi:MAG: GNAT family N-acetyltransferase [Alcanivoracaceae bacterium]
MSRPYPFLEPGFFEALQLSGATGEQTGWQPAHLQRGGDFWMPLWLKSHNRGEYVFDHGWAEAYTRHGLPYFPRLVTAVPFSPVTGPRWRGKLDPDWLRQMIDDALARHGASSWHLLFADADAVAQLEGWPLAHRLGCHFRWFNRGYADFDAFLSALTSRRRKSIRRERLAAQQAGLDIRLMAGDEIPAHWWPDLYRCYAATFYKRGQRPYLPEQFFLLLAQSALCAQMMVAVALRDQRPVAMAFYLFDDQRLYGRYWGALEEVDGLHFELCYYCGIEFCIARGLVEFDPGVQGEHKILRGFEPVITHSLHWMAQPEFHRAVTDFCVREGQMVERYRQDARQLLPFRNANQAQ